MMKTIWTKEADVERNWYIVDAEGNPGPAGFADSSRPAGQHKAHLQPVGRHRRLCHRGECRQDSVTGRRMDQKKYYTHSGYQGGLKERTLRQMMEKSPERVIQLAVRGMLPKSRAGPEDDQEVEGLPAGPSARGAATETLEI